MAAFVFFTAAGQTFALPATEVVEVLRMAAPAPVPGAPPAVRGVLDVRGEVVLVVDARAALGGSPRPVRPEEHLLVLDAGSRRLALEVERVTGVREVPEAALASGAGAVRLEEGVVVVQPASVWLARATAPTHDEAPAEGSASP